MIVDSREDEKIAKIAEKLKLSYVVQRLPVGDFLEYDKGIVVERKTVTDFLTSYTEGRLPEQCQNMELNFDTFYLFISGNIKNVWFNPSLPSHIKKISEKTYTKMRLHLLRTFPGLKIMEFSNDTKLVEGVVELFSYEGNKRVTNIIRRKASKEDIFLSQICCVPGIGLERAKKILGVYKPKELYNAAEEDLKKIEGIGNIHAKKLKEVFN